MEAYIKEYCKYYDYDCAYEQILQEVNNCGNTTCMILDTVIYYKKNVNKFIYKEDMPTLFAIWRNKHNYKELIMPYEKFMENVIKHNRCCTLDKITLKECTSIEMDFYYLGTFLEHRPVDIKIALKD